jgi:hypothetical protein
MARNLLHPSGRFSAITVALSGGRAGHAAKGLS